MCQIDLKMNKFAVLPRVSVFAHILHIQFTCSSVPHFCFIFIYLICVLGNIETTTTLIFLQKCVAL